MNKRITILIPVYNEQAVLPLLLKRLQELADKEAKQKPEKSVNKSKSISKVRKKPPEQSAASQQVVMIDD